jgi:hypothetical protein
MHLQKCTVADDEGVAALQRLSPPGMNPLRGVMGWFHQLWTLSEVSRCLKTLQWHLGF